MGKIIIKTITFLLVAIWSSHILLAQKDNQSVNKDSNAIYITGEYHYDPECEELKKVLRKKARNEKIIFADESLFFDEKRIHKVFGIEERHLYYLVPAWRNYMDFALYKIIQDTLSLNEDSFEIDTPEMLKFFKNELQIAYPSAYHRLKLILLALLNVDNGGVSIYPTNKEIIDSLASITKLEPLLNIDQCARDPLNSNINEEVLLSLKNITQFIENHSFEKPYFLNLHSDIDQWIKLFKDLSFAYFQEIPLQDDETFQQILNLAQTYSEKIQEYIKMDAETKLRMLPIIKEDYYKWASLDIEIMKNLREKGFLKNTIKIYENNKWKNKPLYVSIGLAHAPFLYEELKKLGYNVQLNDLAQSSYILHLIKQQKVQLIDKNILNRVIKFELKRLSSKRLDVLENSFRTADSYETKNLLMKKIAVELGVQLHKLGFFAIIIENKLIDDKVLDSKKLTQILLDKLNSADWKMQHKTLILFIELVSASLIDQRVISDCQLGKHAMERFDKHTQNILFLFGILIEKGLIDKKFITTYELIEKTIEKLDHKELWTKVNALWVLSLILQQNDLLAIEKAAKGLQLCYPDLILEFTIPKESIERLLPVFRQFLAHPNPEIQLLAAEINIHLEKLLSS